MMLNLCKFARTFPAIAIETLWCCHCIRHLLLKGYHDDDQ